MSAASAAAIARLRAYKPPPTSYGSLPLSRRAAVLILLFVGREGELRVVLTMRSRSLSSYAGQAALPGGKADTPSETPLQTSRREAFEEIGLPLSDAGLPPPFIVEHLCLLPMHLAKTELGVMPCVAFLNPSASPSSLSEASTRTAAIPDVETTLIPRLDAKEVAAVFTAPFASFLESSLPPSSSSSAANPTPAPEAHKWYHGLWTEWHETRWRMHNFYVPYSSSNPVLSSPSSSSPFKPSSSPDVSTVSDTRTPTDIRNPTHFRVFGMTARILVDAARVAYAREPEFEHNGHFGDEGLIARLLGCGLLQSERRRGEEVER
ncbi:hypothetical protein M501DRAFT_901431, partial [Patellaria atrata CBS 101060]